MARQLHMNVMTALRKTLTLQQDVINMEIGLICLVVLVGIFIHDLYFFTTLFSIHVFICEGQLDMNVETALQRTLSRRSGVMGLESGLICMDVLAGLFIYFFIYLYVFIVLLAHLSRRLTR